MVMAVLAFILAMKNIVEDSMAISGTDLLEVPTIYKAYFSGLCKGIPPENMALYGTVPPF